MEFICFAWDSNKERANQKKLRVSFDEAQFVFYDPEARLIADPDHSGEEERFILLGVSAKRRILLVCHCYREDELTIRIISARKAIKTEIRYYMENRDEAGI